jgi:uncharacterized membrane protein YjjB (DUF3815 family)
MIEVVALLGILAVLLVFMAPHTGLSAAKLHCVRAAGHVTRCLVGALQPVALLLGSFVIGCASVHIRPQFETALISQLFELDCAWLC